MKRRGNESISQTTNVESSKFVRLLENEPGRKCEEALRKTCMSFTKNQTLFILFNQMKNVHLQIHY